MNNNLKKCKQCKLNKPVSEFSKETRTYYIKKTNEKITKSYYGSYCNKCIKIRIKVLNARRGHKKVNRDDGGIRWSRVLTGLRKGAKERKIKCNIDQIDFKRWLSEQTHKCTYCGYGPEESKKILSPSAKNQVISAESRLRLDMVVHNE